MIRKDKPVKMSSRPLLLKATSTRASVSHRSQSRTKGQVHTRRDKFHQYEMFNEITQVVGERVEPGYFSIEGRSIPDLEYYPDKYELRRRGLRRDITNVSKACTRHKAGIAPWSPNSRMKLRRENI